MTVVKSNITKDNGQNEPVKYAILRVKTLSFFVNEHLFINDLSKELKVELGQSVQFGLDTDILEFRIRAIFNYPETPELVLSEIVVQNVFKIENLSSYIKGNKVVLPATLMIPIVGLSISHCRALLSQNLAGTVLQDFILSITNPVDVAIKFYPNIIYHAQKNEVSGHAEFTMITNKVTKQVVPI